MEEALAPLSRGFPLIVSFVNRFFLKGRRFCKERSCGNCPEHLPGGLVVLGMEDPMPWVWNAELGCGSSLASLWG